MAEKARWGKDGRLSLAETGTSQVISWFEERLVVLDTHFHYSVDE